MAVDVMINILRLPSIVLFVTLGCVDMLIYFGSMLSHLALVLNNSMNFGFDLIDVRSDR